MLTARRRKHLVALLLLDFDGFKRINDELGHAAGDELLRIAARRLIRDHSRCRYCLQIRGDEFVIMLPHIDHAAEVVSVAAKIRAAPGRPRLIDGSEVTVTAGAGYGRLPGRRQYRVEELIRQADLAMVSRQGAGYAWPGLGGLRVKR